MKNFIVIIDYGVSNLYSVFHAIKKVSPDSNVVISSDHKVIKKADRIILPGQGSMSYCINMINYLELFEVIKYSLKNKPVFGICIGKQILFNNSEEGNVDCFGILCGNVVRFNFNKVKFRDNYLLKVPHIGWNNIYKVKSHKLLNGISNYSFFYFVHSYYVLPKDDKYIFCKTLYGVSFPSVIIYKNIFATQFHPEKSSYLGLQMYYNFINWKP